MSSRLCIHGHFYQPPRFDPWLDEVLPEASAAPFINWNERINRECYAPLAFARRMDSQGYIFSIINCYEYISFNFGPTILSWMEKHRPEIYQRILEGDRKSVGHFGKGNAMAQIYHHIIMPLSTDHDRDIEINWSIVDFEHRYGRRPEGMWLAETAVCTDTLEALARAEIKFTILAPRQAEAVSGLNDENWMEVSEQTLDNDRPYLVRLPSGNEIVVFFYDGPLSQAVAFEQLLVDGRHFWDRLLTRKDCRLLSLATDGESYGHHFKFGEMALAYVLEQALTPQSPLKLTNYASFLEDNPPQERVRIKEKSSWSCIHGIERWREDCGCRNGGHQGWNQMWRKPLRRALNLVKYYIDQHYRTMGSVLFKDEHKALLDYGRCLCGVLNLNEFLELHQQKKLDQTDKIKAMKLMEMQQAGLASFSSCAWFFDDIARIEPLNSLSWALKAMNILRDLQGPDVEPQFLEILEEAYSNEKGIGDGKKIWADLVLPRRVETSQMAAISLGTDNIGKPVSFPGLDFELKRQGDNFILGYEWHKTGEKGKKTLKIQDKPESDDFAVIVDEDGSVFSLKNLDKRLNNFILWNEDLKRETILWQDILDLASSLKTRVAAPFQEGQKSPLAGLGILSLGIMFLYLKAGDNCPELEIFWKDIYKNNPYFRDILAQKVSGELDNICAGPQPDWNKGADLISRSINLGIYPDLFIVQNRLWLEGLENAGPEIAAKFFLKKDGGDEKS